MSWIIHYFNIEDQGTVGELSRNSYFSVLGHPSELVTKDVEKIHFEVVLFVEFFLAYMVRQRTLQVVVCRSQVWRIRRMWNRDPSELQ
jgi:hypothetical protein